MILKRADLATCATSSRVGRPGSQRRRILGLTLLTLLAVIVVACGGSEPEQTDGSIADGVVVDVQGTITQVESFELALQDGSRLSFVPEAGALERSGFSPAHLREHSALAQPISVRYHVVDGENRATSIGDVDE